MIEVARPKLATWTHDDHWHEAVNRSLALDQLESLCQSVVRGTPQGDPSWTTALVKQAGLEATVRPRGRPPKLADPVMV